MDPSELFLSKNLTYKIVILFRLNSVESGLCMTDMETILSGERLPSAVHLPKVMQIVQVGLKETCTIISRMRSTQNFHEIS
jgi:hypothetical protein